MSRIVTHHSLKCWPLYFAPVKLGLKTWEFRKDDRDFKVGDVLVLHEWEPKVEVYTKRSVAVRVIYIARGGLIPEGHVVMSVQLTGDA